MSVRVGPIWCIATAWCLALGCASRPVQKPEPRPVASNQPPSSSVRVIPIEDLTWGPLNPARGDQSPRAATLWGDRSSSAGPTGFLVRFADGFSSPPHIHNVTYRAVVIAGLIHNDHPDAVNTWMPPASYWTQPDGAVHITSALGESMALVEIDDGPYLVRPPADAYETSETARNVMAIDTLWTSIDGGTAGVHQSLVWGNEDDSHGLLVKIDPSRTASFRSTGLVRFVVIAGEVELQGEGAKLSPGSQIQSQGPVSVVGTCKAQEPCVLYGRVHSGSLSYAPPS